MKLTVLQFISHLRKSDNYIEHIYTKGGCYKFHLLLKSMFGGECLINNEKNHVVTLIEGKCYDITGRVYGTFNRLDSKDLKMVRKWSFCNNNLLQLKECPFCEEPICV